MGRLTKITVLMATALVFAGCTSPQKEQSGQTPAPITTTSQALPSATETTTLIADGNCLNLEDVDRSNPDAVSRGYVMIAYCWDSAHDRTLTAASIRAKDLMTDDYAQLQVEPERNSAQGMFNRAYEHQAYSEPSLTLSPTEMNSQDTEDTATRVYLVEWNWKGRDGINSTGGRAIVTVGMVKEGDTWKIAGSSMDGFTEER